MHLSSSSPSGGGGRGRGGGCRWRNWGLCGDLVAYLCPLGGGNDGPVIYYEICTPQTTEKYGDFASAKVQGNWERASICTIHS